MVDKKKLANVLAMVMTSWLKDATVHVINANLMWFSCAHQDKADLTPLEDLGIKLPDYHSEKHWVRDYSTFDFWLDQKIFDNIANKLNNEVNNAR